jgi:hypothetical protein
MNKKDKLKEMKIALSNLKEEREKADKAYSSKISRLNKQVKELNAEVISDDAIEFLKGKTNYWIGNKILEIKTNSLWDDNSDLIIVTGTPVVKENNNGSEAQYTVISGIVISNNYGSGRTLTISTTDDLSVSKFEKGYQNVTKEEFMLKYAEWDKKHKENLFKEISKVPDLLENNILNLTQ